MIRALLAAALTAPIQIPNPGTPVTAQIRCVEQLCLVPECILMQLANQAATAEQYAALCKWSKP